MDRICAPAAPAPKGPYHHATVVGELVFCSGMIGMDPATEAIPERIGEQTTLALRNLDAVANAAGARLQDAARLTIYLVDFADLHEMNRAYSQFFGDATPARTTLQVSALAGGARVCLDAIVLRSS